MSNFTVFKTSTGEILRVGSAPPDMVEIQALVDETVVEGHFNGRTQYWNGSIFIDKAPLPGTWNKTSFTADGVDAATLSGLPNPTTITVYGQSIDSDPVVVTDGVFELSTDTPGGYIVTAVAFPYLSLTTELVAT